MVIPIISSNMIFYPL